MAAAGPPEDGLYTGVPGPQRAISLDRVVVSSISNANDRFRVHVSTREALGTRQALWLWWEGAAVAGTGWSAYPKEAGRWAYVDLDGARARAVAERYGAEVRERTPLGTGLRAVWSREGATVRLHLVNDGPEVAVGVCGIPTAACGFGQLTFALILDGERFEMPQSMYVGPVLLRRLAPGEHIDLDTDLRQLFPRLEGTEGQIECRYDSVAAESETWPGFREEQRLWTLHFEHTFTGRP